MFNTVILTGRLTGDPELKTTPSGVSVTSFSIAVDRRYKQGEDRQTDFINIVAWRSAAEFITKYFKKGSLIGLEGSIQTRNYTDKNGNKRTAFEVVAKEVQFVESKKADTQDSGAGFTNADTADFTELSGVSDEDLPF